MDRYYLCRALNRLVRVYGPADRKNRARCRVVPWDRLPPLLLDPRDGVAFYICNTEVFGKGGKHWIAVHVPDSGPVEYFDPTGAGFTPGELHPHDYTYLTNTLRVQRDSSPNCGWFCLQFCKRRLLGQNMVDACRAMYRGCVI